MGGTQCASDEIQRSSDMARPLSDTMSLAVAIRRSPRLNISNPLQHIISNLHLPLLPPTIGDVKTQRAEKKAQAIAAGTNKRKLIDIINKRKADVPPDFPSGPWKDLDTAFANIQFYCKNSLTGGGAHAIGLSTPRAQTATAGEKHDVVCCFRNKFKQAIGPIRKRGSSATECKWRVSLEHAQEGWVIRDFPVSEHNHDLAKTTEEHLANPSLRKIPLELEEIGIFLKSTFHKPTEIDKYECHVYFVSIVNHSVAILTYSISR